MRPLLFSTVVLTLPAKMSFKPDTLQTDSLLFSCESGGIKNICQIFCTVVRWLRGRVAELPNWLKVTDWQQIYLFIEHLRKHSFMLMKAFLWNNVSSYFRVRRILGKHSFIIVTTQSLTFQFSSNINNSYWLTKTHHKGFVMFSV